MTRPDSFIWDISYIYKNSPWNLTCWQQFHSAWIFSLWSLIKRSIFAKKCVSTGWQALKCSETVYCGVTKREIRTTFFFTFFFSSVFVINFEAKATWNQYIQNKRFILKNNDKNAKMHFSVPDWSIWKICTFCFL